jgi:hypothetical protein
MTQPAEADLIHQSIRSCLPSLQDFFGLADSAFDTFTLHPLSGGFGGGVGGTAVYRAVGSGWSLVVKVLEARPDEQPSDSHYWAREAEAYQAPWLQQLDAGLRAPHCFGVTNLSPNRRVLILEAIADALPGKWSFDQHQQVARDIGRFNGTFLNQVPQDACLSRKWIEQDVERFGARITTLTDLLVHPLLREWLHPAKLDLQYHIWDIRHTLFTQLDALPQTLCHFDAFRRNCFATPRGTVAIDWSFVGQGPLGADFSALYWVNAIFQEIDLDNVNMVLEALLKAYVNGLQDAGWQGNPQFVQQGCVIALALRQLAGIGIQVYEIHEALQRGQSPDESHIWHMILAGQAIDRWMRPLLPTP